MMEMMIILIPIRRSVIVQELEQKPKTTEQD
jgi:hypothetical protein